MRRNPPARIVHYTDGAAFGGTEQVILTVLAHLDRERWTSLLLHHQGDSNSLLSERACVVDVRARSVAPLLDGVRTPLNMARFVRRLRAERPAIFHAHLNWPLACQHALICAVAANVPVIVTTSHVTTDIPVGRARRIRRWLNARIDCSIAVSHAVARQLQEEIGIPSERVTIIHNGVTGWPVQNLGQPNRLLVGEPWRANVLSVARLTPQKGLKYLLEAARLLPDVRFAIAGVGPDQEMLEARIRSFSLGERVRLLGHRDDVPHLLAAADVFVLPSLFEGLPLVILEAMAAGTPVIASAIDGVDEIIVHADNGLLVPVGDPAALAQAIERVLADPCYARRLGEAGRRHVQDHFSAAQMVDRHDALYRHLLPGLGGRRG